MSDDSCQNFNLSVESRNLVIAFYFHRNLNRNEVCGFHSREQIRLGFESHKVERKFSNDDLIYGNRFSLA